MLLSQPVSARGCNFYVYVVVGSLLFAIYLEVFQRMLDLLRDRSVLFRSIFAFIIIQSKVLILLRYKISHRGQQQSSLQRDTKLPFRYLVVPTILKLAIYLLALRIHVFINTSLFGLAIFLNLVLCECKNHYSIYQKKRACILQSVKAAGIALYGVALIFSSFDPMPWDSSFLFWGTLLLLIILIQGFLYLTKKLFDVYKPSTDQFLSKQYLVETLTIIISSVIVLFVGLEFNFDSLTGFLDNLLEEIKTLPITQELMMYSSASWLLTPVAQSNLFNMVKELSSNESFFILSGFIFWLNIISLVKNPFNIFNFLSEFLFVVSAILYFRVVKLRYLIRFVNFITQKGRKVQAPIPLH